MVLQYYAHVRENANGRKEYQTVAQHLTGTAELCREFAAAFGAEADGELAGLSHDIGKCTDAFQDHLLNDGPTVDHATAGAMACAMRGNRYASACVAGHHGGLPDFGNMRTARKADGTFYGRMRNGIWSAAEKAARRCLRRRSWRRKGWIPYRLHSGRECSIPAWWTPIFWIRSGS